MRSGIEPVGQRKTHLATDVRATNLALVPASDTLAVACHAIQWRGTEGPCRACTPGNGAESVEAVMAAEADALGQPRCSATQAEAAPLLRLHRG